MIILSVPFSSEKKKLIQKIACNFDLIEYRLDYKKKLETLEISILNDKTILTVRDKKEGGKNNFSRHEKLKLYNEMVEKTKTLVDDEILHYLDEEPIINPNHLILSWHAMNDENAYQMLPEIVALSNRLPSKYLKIAIQVDNYTQLQVLHTELAQSNKPVLFAGLGKLGKLSRLLNSHLGAIGTYVGLQGNETAPGQLTFEESITFRLGEITKDHLIGGVIGKDNVWESLGLRHYNVLFVAYDLQARYLPFAVEDWDDFWCWFLNASKYITFYGFSITMPWKKHIAKAIESTEPMLNTFLPLRYEYNLKVWEYNTDETAFNKSLAYLKVSKGASVLLFGTGAMAELALSVLSAYANVSVYGRNDQHLRNLKAQYACNVISEEGVCASTWDLLINCTPVGMDGEDVMSCLGEVKFTHLIDLPYSITETEIVKYSREHNIPFVSGSMFWEWQAEEQEKVFVEEIERLTAK